MRKKRLALARGLCLLTLTLVWLFFFPMKEESIIKQVLTEEEQRRLTKELDQTEEEVLTGLLFAGEVLPYDQNSETFYLPVDMDTEEWEAGNFSAQNADVKVWLLDNPLQDQKSQAIVAGKRYRLLAVNQDFYKEYALVFTGLPILCIETETGKEIRYEELFGSMRFYEADKKEDWVRESIMSGHIRGGSSRLNHKKSYKMTLYKQDQSGNVLRKNEESFLGMRSDDEWILYAMYSEGSKLRDKLSLDIWNQSGALEIETNGFYGYHMEYIEVFQNGEYWGLYGLMEPVDYKQLALTGEQDYQPEEYLYKQKDPGVFEVKGNHSVVDEAHYKVLNEYLACLEADDETFAAEIADIIDVENALDVWLYLQAVIGMDNVERNIFYPAVWDNGQYRIRFMPWDMDYTWGNVHDFDAGNRTRFSEEILTMRIAWKLGDRLVELNVENAREKVAARWKELRQSVYSEEWLKAQIDAYAHQVSDSGAYERNRLRWTSGWHNADYEFLKEVACERMEFLDAYMEMPERYLELKEYME